MWFRILILALGAFAIGTDSFVVAGILPDIATGLNISLALAGVTVTVFALVYGIGAPIFATLMGRFERKRLLLLSLAILALANILSAISPNIWFLLATRMLAAMGASLFTPTASAVAVSLVPMEKRGRALALVMTGLTASTILGVPLGIFIGAHLNWQSTLIFVSLLSVFALLGILLLFKAVIAPPVVSLNTRFAFLKRPGLAVALSHTLLFMGGTQLVITYLRPIFDQITHIDETTVSWMMLIFGIAGVIGGFWGGYGADRWGGRRLLLGGIAILVLVFGLFPWLASSLFTIIPTLIILGMFGWSLAPAQQHRLIAFAPESAGIILSLNSSALYLGISLGSAIGGLLVENSTLLILCEAGAIWQALTLVFIYITTRSRKRGVQEEITHAA